VEKTIAQVSVGHLADDQRIFGKEARSLAEAGCEVAYVVHDALGEDQDGVSFVDLGVRRRRLNRLWHSLFGVLPKLRKLPHRVFQIHEPELLIAGFCMQLLGRKVIYDSHEDTPRQILGKPWIPKPLRSVVSRLTEFVEGFICGRISGVVAATPRIAERFNSNKTVTVQNFPVLTEFSKVERSFESEDRRKVLVYVGGLTRGRGIVECLKALELLPDFTMHVAGPWESEQLKNECQEMCLDYADRITFHGLLPRDEIVDLLSTASIGLVTLHPFISYQEAYPVKMFEYMACGLPVVASDFPLWRRIVDGAECGELVDPLDPKAIAAAARRIAGDPKRMAHMSESGRVAVEQEYSWERQAEKLVEFYETKIFSDTGVV